MVNDKIKTDYLSFIIDDKTYAVPILSLIGVVGNPRIIPFTDSIECITGIFNISGINIPIFDLRLILNKPNVVFPSRTCIIIVRVVFKDQEKLVGFVVDSLYSIYHIHLSEIEKLSAYSENELIDEVATKDGKMIMLLKMEKIINRIDIICFLNQFWNYEISRSQVDKNGV